MSHYTGQEIWRDPLVGILIRLHLLNMTLPLSSHPSFFFSPETVKVHLRGTTYSGATTPFQEIRCNFYFVGCVTCSNGLFVLMPFPPTKIQLSLKPKLVITELPKSAISFLASSLSLHDKTDRYYFMVTQALRQSMQVIHI